MDCFQDLFETPVSDLSAVSSHEMPCNYPVSFGTLKCLEFPNNYCNSLIQCPDINNNIIFVCQ